VVEALERLYPCNVADIRPGRSRYALLLNERGHVIDDGMILRESDTRFALSFTSGGASFAEMWVRDWIETWGLDVHVLDRTFSLAAINVTGPFAGELLRRAGLAEPPKMLQHVHADVAGVPCHVMRLSFTGEASFELHHLTAHSVELWRELMRLGADLGIHPHGLQALFGLRLEKGHFLVGLDSEMDSTPARLGLDWAVKMEKPFFIGRPALARTASLENSRQLFGMRMDGPAPIEGAPIFDREGGAVIGHVATSFSSPLLGHAVLLGWQKRLPFLDTVFIDGRTATVAPDDALVIDATVDDAAPVATHDPYAIIEPEAMFRGAWLDDAQLEALTHKLEWPLPAERPALAQGMVYGLAIKLVLETDRTLLIVSGSAFHEVADRLGAVA
jgi:sarcosine oxidase subunit alpha